jgi:hypothetical protein
MSPTIPSIASFKNDTGDVHGNFEGMPGRAIDSGSEGAMNPSHESRRSPWSMRARIEGGPRPWNQGYSKFSANDVLFVAIRRSAGGRIEEDPIESRLDAPPVPTRTADQVGSDRKQFGHHDIQVGYQLFPVG